MYTLVNNYSLELFGTEFKMGSNEIIAQMINSLVIDDQQETALLFIDKLGLADTYIRHMSNEIDFDGMKDNIRNAFDKANRFNHFRKEIEPAFENAINILSEENPKFAKTMNQTRKQIKTLGEKYSIEEKYLDILYKALDNIKYTTSENPNAQKGLVFNTVINVAKTQMTDTIKSDIAALDETARASAIVMDIINQILLPNDSELNEIRDRLNEEFQEIAELKQYFIDLQQQEESAKI